MWKAVVTKVEIILVSKMNRGQYTVYVYSQEVGGRSGGRTNTQEEAAYPNLTS